MYYTYSGVGKGLIVVQTAEAQPGGVPAFRILSSSMPVAAATRHEVDKILEHTGIWGVYEY